MHVMTTMIAVPRQNVKKENAFVKETQLETGNTVEVLLNNNPYLMWDALLVVFNRPTFIMTR